MATLTAAKGTFSLTGIAATLTETGLLGSGGPFYFAWADSSETTFGPQHYAYDETIFRFSLAHDEGQIPTLEIEILNPNVGLLNSGRKQWAWFSWFDGSSVVPLFFGRLVGIPTDMLGRTATLQFIARANDYLTRKRNLAQTLKVRPYYDPLFLDEKARNDPDAILEGYSAAWHVDRTTLDWTISDILRPEDGTYAFTESDVFYDSVSITVGEQPLKTVYVKTNVGWNNSGSGGIPVGMFAISSFTGNGILSDWPKPGASLGGGWYAADSWAYDLAGADNAQVLTYTGSYTNNDTKHAIGDTMSANYSYQELKFGGRKVFVKAEYVEVFGSVMGGPNDTPTSSFNSVTEFALRYDILAYLSVRYQTNTGFGENLQFRMDADIQNVLFDAETEQEAEVLDLTAADVTQPIVDYTTAGAVENTNVSLGQIIYDPANNYQIAVEAGLSGSTPTFATVIGDETVDLGVTWVCLGPVLPAIGSWRALASYTRGALIAPTEVDWVTYSSAASVGMIDHKGTAIVAGTIVKADNGLSYQKCITAGTTSGWVPDFSTTPGDVTVDGTVEWLCLGPNLPTGVTQICVTAGVSDDTAPAFGVSGETVTDGTVEWTSLATSPAAITSAVSQSGITSDATSFFPTDRGAWACEYCLMRARARMLTRARAIEIGFATTFANGVNLSCRMGAQISDPRIPGGVAEGKIINYTLVGDGSTGEFLTQIKIGVPVGLDGTITAAAGTPVWADGYVNEGYQQMTGSVISVGGGGLDDVGYTPLTDPAYSLTVDTGISAFVVGTAAAQEGYVKTGIVPPVYLSLTLPDLTNSEYSTPYNLPVTSLKVPQGIDLSAA